MSTDFDNQTCLGRLRYTEIDTGFDSPCHLWSRGRTPGGYGMLRRDGRMVYGHLLPSVDAALAEGLGSLFDATEPDNLRELRAN